MRLPMIGGRTTARRMSCTFPLAYPAHKRVEAPMNRERIRELNDVFPVRTYRTI